MKTAIEPKRAFNERDCFILDNFTDIKTTNPCLLERIKAGGTFDKTTYRMIQGMVKSGDKVYNKNRSYMMQSPSREEASKAFLSQSAFNQFYQEFVVFRETVRRCTKLKQKDFDKTHQELMVEAKENLCIPCKFDIRDCGKHKDSKAVVKFPLLKMPHSERVLSCIGYINKEADQEEKNG